MPNLKELQTIPDYNRVAEEVILKLKAFLAIEQKNNHKFVNRYMGKFLCPVIEFYHSKEKGIWVERLSLFNFPIVKDDQTTCIIFDDVNNLQPVVSRIQVPGKSPDASEMNLIFSEVKNFLKSKALTNRVCQGKNFIRVQTVPMAKTIKTFLETNQKLQGFNFEKHGEDIFVVVSPVVKKAGETSPTAGFQNTATNEPDPNEDFIKKVITEIFDAIILVSDYKETGSLVVGFDTKDTAEKTGLLCNEYGLDCIQYNQTLIFDRKAEYPFSFDDIKECFTKKSVETVPSNALTEDISDKEFCKQVRVFVKEAGYKTKANNALNKPEPYVYCMGLIGDLDPLIEKLSAEKKGWRVEKGRGNSGYLRFSLISKVPVKKEKPADGNHKEVIEKPAASNTVQQAATDVTEPMIAIATQMPVSAILIQIPDDYLVKEVDKRGLNPVASDDDVWKEFEQRGLKQRLSNDDVRKEFVLRDLIPDISDSDLTKMVKDRGAVFAGALMQALLQGK